MPPLDLERLLVGQQPEAITEIHFHTAINAMQDYSRQSIGRELCAKVELRRIAIMEAGNRHTGIQVALLLCHCWWRPQHAAALLSTPVIKPIIIMQPGFATTATVTRLLISLHSGTFSGFDHMKCLTETIQMKGGSPKCFQCFFYVLLEDLFITLIY